jgi:adenylate kinase family enzyme
VNYLTKIDGNCFISEKDQRHLFKSKGVDLEQMSPEELQVFSDILKSDLNLISSKDTFTIYGLDTGVYLDSKGINPLSRSLKLIECHEGLKPFFNMENIYSSADFTGGDFCKINGQYFRFISINPEENTPIEFGLLSKLGELMITFKKIETRISKNLVDDSRKMNHASLYKMLSDIEGIEAYRENEQVLWKIINREEELFKARIVFIVRAITEDGLYNKTTSLITELANRSLGPNISNYYINEDFQSFTAGLIGDLTESHILRTSLFINCLPIHTDVIHKSGVSLHARSGKQIELDTMKGDSFSIAITGVTGSGKTFFAQKLCTHEIERGHALFMIDPKRDYEKFSLLNQFRIIEKDVNPMIFKDDIYFKNILISKIPQSERTELWEGQLLKAIRQTETYKENSFYKALSTLEKNGFPELEFYFEDMKGRITSKNEDFGKYVYTLSSSFTDKTLPFILTYAFEYLKRLKCPYKFVIDEAHRVFNSNPMYLAERVREVRVLKSGLIINTQSFIDLVSTDFGKVVADCCEHKFFFRQVVDERSSLKPHEMQMIKDLRKVDGFYSECLYKSTGFSKIIQYRPSLRELEIFKSGEEERIKILKYINERLGYLTIDQAIDNYVREVHCV